MGCYDARKKYPMAYACKHTDIETRLESRSGGVFTAISDLILNQNGVVYGCALNENFEAVHQRAVTGQERDAFRKSKYVQSDMGNTYRDVQKDLSDGKAVLFSGTPCQVDGLKRFLAVSNTNTQRLLTMDLACHGVPSPKLWRD